jgi:hypothetical protein
MQDPAQGAQQSRASRLHFALMMQREFAQHLFAFRSQREQHFPSIFSAPLPLDETTGCQAID